MNRLGLLSSIRIAHMTCYRRCLLLYYIQVLCQSRLCKAGHAYLILCYNGSLVTWTVVSLTTAKFKPLIFSVFGFALSYTANMFILVILYDFCFLIMRNVHLLFMNPSILFNCHRHISVQRTTTNTLFLLITCWDLEYACNYNYILVWCLRALLKHNRHNRCNYGWRLFEARSLYTKWMKLTVL
jgi:hypothetical protein